MRFGGPRDIKVHVNRYLENNKEKFRNKVVIDVPAGTGISSQTLLNLGADVEAYDLFPQFFKTRGVTCHKADIARGLPVQDGRADYVLCQEGIEHLPDQLHAMKEFNRILKKEGSLLITTPNYSNIRARLSYLFGESEHYKFMPPNEIESIWVAGEQSGDEIYYGHIFLTGIQKLRTLARLAGFRIRRIIHIRINFTSFIFLIILYPFIWLNRRLAYRRAMRKTKTVDKATKKDVFEEQFKLGVDLNILAGSHLFIEFEKAADTAEVNRNLKGMITDFDTIT